ncbi:MAG: hypothetical protein WC957_04725, partial [Candidatus Neomarinimicrobiota bacterium]
MRNTAKNNFADRHSIEELYDSTYEHDSCGVGFVARLDGVATHQIVQDSITVLANLEHRGALGG